MMADEIIAFIGEYVLRNPLNIYPRKIISSKIGANIKELNNDTIELNGFNGIISGLVKEKINFERGVYMPS